jgi:hypothetical protein
MTHEQMKATATVCLVTAYILIAEVIRYWLLGPEPVM